MVSFEPSHSSALFLILPVNVKLCSIWIWDPSHFHSTILPSICKITIICGMINHNFKQILYPSNLRKIPKNNVLQIKYKKPNRNKKATTLNSLWYMSSNKEFLSLNCNTVHLKNPIRVLTKTCWFLKNSRWIFLN